MTFLFGLYYALKMDMGRGAGSVGTVDKTRFECVCNWKTFKIDFSFK